MFYDDFTIKINDFVTSLLGNYYPTDTGDKVIHDPIWGSVIYYNLEIQIIDSPLFQRLRDIKQLGLAELTYPAARHSRLEHSLGTAAISSRMMEKLSECFKKSFKEFELTQADIYLVRLAALLHDTGHCLYSHLSEAIYRNMPEFKQITGYVIKNSGQNISPKPHEIFSYLIVTSKAFTDFFQQNIAYPNKTDKCFTRNLLQKAGNMIIGVNNIEERGGLNVCLSFMTSIINGDFDADKLDYTQRDSYTAGIALTYGVERFLLKIIVNKHDGDIPDYRLSINSDAVTTVEELVFNRFMLYNYMYRHQKVMATECLMRDAIYALVKLGKIKHPSDFLYYTDSKIDCIEDNIPFYELAPNRTLSSLLTDLKNRYLPKRCMELNRNILKSSGDEIADICLNSLEKECIPEKKREILFTFSEKIREEIPEDFKLFLERQKEAGYDEYLKTKHEWYEILCSLYKEKDIPVDFDIFDLHIALPDFLSSDIKLTVVSRSGEQDNSNIKGLIEWANLFNLSKWHGYFFVSPKINLKLAHEASKLFLHKKFPQINLEGTEKYIKNLSRF